MLTYRIIAVKDPLPNYCVFIFWYYFNILRQNIFTTVCIN